MDNDYHEVFPTRWEITAAYAICCAKCHQTKLAKHFRQRVPKHEAHDRGYVGMDKTRLPRALQGERVITKESKYCTDCQKKGRYRPTQMTAAQIYEAAHNGQVSLDRANADVERKRRKTAHKLSAAATNRWAQLKGAPWAHIQAKLTDELDYVRFALNYYTKKRPEFEEMVGFLQELRLTLRAVVARCALDARAQRKADKDLTWHTLIDAQSLRRLTHLWDAIPLSFRSRLRRIPAVLNNALCDEPLLADFVPLGPRPVSERQHLIAEIIHKQQAT